MQRIISGRTSKKLLLSLVLISIAVLSYNALVDRFLQKTFINRLDERGSEYLDRTLKRAIGTFVIVRGLNAVISPLQGTDIDVSPGGVGITIALGEILDPINDLIERFSVVMLISTTSLGIQKILMEVGEWFGFRILLTFSLIVMLIGIWAQNITKINFYSLGYRLILASIIIRFLIPTVSLVNDKIYDHFLKERAGKANQALEQINIELKDEQIDGLGLWDSLKTKYREGKQKIEYLKNRISRITDYVIDLIIVFTLQTVIIPIFVIWLLNKLFGYLAGFDAKISDKRFKEILTSFNEKLAFKRHEKTKEV